MVCTNEFVGWQRDLTQEGIEPNPGPEWTTILPQLQNYFPKSHQAITSALQEIENMILDSEEILSVTEQDMRNYLTDDGNSTVFQKLKISSNIRQDLIRLLDSALQGKRAYNALTSCIF